MQLACVAERPFLAPARNLSICCRLSLPVSRTLTIHRQRFRSSSSSCAGNEHRDSGSFSQSALRSAKMTALENGCKNQCGEITSAMTNSVRSMVIAAVLYARLSTLSLLVSRISTRQA